MKIDIKLLTEEDSEYVGKDLWIAEVNRKTERGRYVTPQLAQLTPNSEAGKTIYYSSNYFKPYSDKGKLLKKVVAIFDNTGFRSFTGNPISVFDNEAECKQWFNEQIQVIIDERTAHRVDLLANYDAVTQSFIDMKKE